MAFALLCIVNKMIESLFNGANYQASKQLLDAAVVRQSALASNIANIETPGYKRVDLPKDFNQQLANSLRNGSAAPTAKIIEDASATGRSKNGNNVELEKELIAMNKNGAEYEVLTEFVSGSIKQLKTAITGRNA